MGMHTSASRDRRSGRNSDTLTVRICLAALRKLLGCGSVIAGVTLTPDWLRALCRDLSARDCRPRPVGVPGLIRSLTAAGVRRWRVPSQSCLSPSGPEPVTSLRAKEQRMDSLSQIADVVIGVDTHIATHSAAAVDTRTGGVLAEVTVEATPEGYEAAGSVRGRACRACGPGRSREPAATAPAWPAISRRRDELVRRSNWRREEPRWRDAAASKSCGRLKRLRRPS